jgi:redox-sensitive bicupin YhaK (pirin superfamily)
VSIRKLKQVIQGVKTVDGAGVKLTRFIGSPTLDMLDPFLLLDEFGSENPDDYIAGFPPHPHRGFETITYMLNGKWQHKDSSGYEGLLGEGSVQWMTAGRGIIHSEMPIQTNGLARGFQLWLNLPQSKKMIQPSYQDIHAKQISTVNESGNMMKIISGDYKGTVGPGKSHTPILILDIFMPPHSKLILSIPNGWNAFGLVYEGEVHSSELITKSQLIIFEKNGEIQLKTNTKSATIYFAAGEPLNEPVARGGPFVMNTRGEILQALADYEEGKIGR